MPESRASRLSAVRSPVRIGSRRAEELCHDGSGLDAIAVVNASVDHDAIVEQRKRERPEREPRNDPASARHDACRSGAVGFHDRIGRKIAAAAEVFDQRAAGRSARRRA